jgi:YfiH family protein
VFSWREEVRPGLWAAFTSAAAGNLALHTGDDPVRVRQKRGKLESEMGLEAGGLHFMNQTHSLMVSDVPGRPGTAPDADALVSPDGSAALAVLVADCVPVLLADVCGSAAPTAAVHAGRRGVAGGIVANTVARMRAVGASDIRAWIGPAVCARCYEVPAAMQEAVVAGAPEARARSARGTPALDLPAGVAGQLERLGIPSHRISGCTYEDAGLYSHRRDPQGTGRFAGLVWRA